MNTMFAFTPKIPEYLDERYVWFFNIGLPLDLDGLKINITYTKQNIEYLEPVKVYTTQY